MKHVKIYEEYIRLQDTSFNRGYPVDRKYYKYKVDDYTKVISLDRIYKVKSINDASENQDYYIVNPIDNNDRGWVVEEELTDPTPDEIISIESKINANKYNL